ncbi:MAG: cardiolipin synthase B [Acidobacteria bacterium]|nr:cardiolipin synthase B [Acidobacteriota bacterium]
MDIGLWIIAGLLALVELSRLAAALARPEPPYRVLGDAPPERLVTLLSSMLDTPVHHAASVEGFRGGDAFYPAQLEAIRRAQRSIHLNVYIFHPCMMADRYVEELTRQAEAGLEVRVLLDAFGSLRMTKRRFRRLMAAGGQVEFYHPLRWHSWPLVNHRNHQNVLVLDGETAFVGGAGVSDYWDGGRGKRPPWNDTMFRITGGAVTGLQAAFAENWLEATGELLGRERDYPEPDGDGAPTLTVNSSPTHGGSTRARVLFQRLLRASRESVLITTPYFLPDGSARAEMIRAMRERGVKIEVLAPGRSSVPFFTRRCSRRHYGELLQAGAKIHEYGPAMMHAKAMVVDGVWTAIGSTNFDPRSFGINDEINVAVYGPELAQTVEGWFREDLRRSRNIEYAQWRRRPLTERLTELMSSIFERQQ